MSASFPAYHCGAVGRQSWHGGHLASQIFMFSRPVLLKCSATYPNGRIQAPELIFADCCIMQAALPAATVLTVERARVCASE